MSVSDWVGIIGLGLVALGMLSGVVVWLVKLGGELAKTNMEIARLKERAGEQEKCHSDLLDERKRDKEHFEARLQHAEGLAGEIKSLTMTIAHQSDRFTAEISHMSKFNGQALEQLALQVSDVRHEQRNLKQMLQQPSRRRPTLDEAPA